MFDRLRKIEHGVNTGVAAAIGLTALAGAALWLYGNRDNPRLRNGLASAGERGLELFDKYLAAPLAEQGVDVERGRRVAQVAIRRLRTDRRPAGPPVTEPSAAETSPPAWHPEAYPDTDGPSVPRQRVPEDVPVAGSAPSTDRPYTYV